MKNAFRLLLLILALCHIASPARLRAEEDWQAAGRDLFESYADAMQGKNYSVFIGNCESKARSLFREFTLWQMDLMTEEDLMGVLPYDADGRPVPLITLLKMSDPDFWTAVKNTALFAFLSVAIQLPLSLGLALLLSQKWIKGVQLWRLAVFMPNLMGQVAVGVLFGVLLQPKFGLVNIGLAQLLG